jgi:acetylornithine deacetylase/succinyl-diaminopimelate desuccinylase-like protein
MPELVHEVTDLLQHLIRNACVNDGTEASGQEVRNADLLQSYLEPTGVAMQRYEPLPGRGNLLARIEGSDATAPSLMLMGHMDVVPVNAANWREDPFAGELIDGEVWGRGAIDMLNLTSSMAVAFRRLAEEGFKPKGTLSFLGVADEEALGTYGAKWLTEHVAEDVHADYLVTETGGFRMPLGGGGPKLPVSVAEKGTYWCRIRVTGTAGHASMPFRTDNALIKAAEIVRRLSEYRPDAVIHDTWRGFVEGLELPGPFATALLDPDAIIEFCEGLAETDLGIARMLHASAHTTFAPTVVHGGVKTNVIPDEVEVQVDIRTLPGDTAESVRAQLAAALGDLYEDDLIVADSNDLASASPVETPLWDKLQSAASSLVPEARNVPFMIVGATDARYWRRIGTVSYGYGLFSEAMNMKDFFSMFHGDNEKVDVGSLELTTELWLRLARSFWD